MDRGAVYRNDMTVNASLLMQELLDENLAKFAEFFKNALLTKFVTSSLPYL